MREGGDGVECHFSGEIHSFIREQTHAGKQAARKLADNTLIPWMVRRLLLAGQLNVEERQEYDMRWQELCAFVNAKIHALWV